MKFINCIDSDKEVKYWKDRYHRSNLMWKALCNCLILTGLRRGELVGLQWGDIDKDMIVHVRRNVTIDTRHKESKDPADKVHIGELKTKEGRKVSITKYLYDLLMEYKAEQEEIYGSAFLPSAFIFCRSTSLYQPLYPSEPTRLMRKFEKRHNLPLMSPHDLRHTAGSLAIEAGASIKDVQQLLGHRDPETTLKFYTGVSEKSSRRTAEGIESLIRPKPKDEEKQA